MVYDSRDDFAANEVVRGYVDSGAAKPESICVRAPLSLVQVPFPGQNTDRGLFVEDPVEKDMWEVAFFPSISERCDLGRQWAIYFAGWTSSHRRSPANDRARWIWWDHPRCVGSAEGTTHALRQRQGNSSHGDAESFRRMASAVR
jgi:hypothetical protein